MRKMNPEMPTDEFVKQRTTNQEDVLDTLRQANSFKQLPSLKEYDDFIEYWESVEHLQLQNVYHQLSYEALLYS